MSISAAVESENDETGDASLFDLTSPRAREEVPIIALEVEEMLPKTKYMTAAEFEERVCKKLNKISEDYDECAHRLTAAIE